MSLIAPLALLLGLLAGPIILLYMLRLRRRQVTVSSTLLWQKLVRDREANAPWQRLRRNLLLLLQLLILAALVLALARPFLPTPSVVSGSVIVILDGSPSMSATDVTPTRFEAAKAEVAGWIDDLGGDDRMTLILAGRTPTVLASATNDRAQLRQALDAAQAQNAPANWPATVALAGGAAQGFSDARVVIVSDGGLPQELPPLPAETVYVPIGESGENLALAALATRATESGPQLFARVSNNGTLDQEALLSIDVDGALFDSRRVQAPAGQTRSLTWDLPADAQIVAARLGDQTQDYLPLDDRAWAVHQGGASNRVLLVSEGNRFIEQVLGVLPGLTVFRAPAGDPLPQEPFDLYVFDSAPLPVPLPDGQLLVVNPLAQDDALAQDNGPQQDGAADHDLFSVTGVFSETTVTRLADSPLLQFVEWRGVSVARAKSVTAPWAQAIIEAQGGPLLLAGEQDGRRVALLTFALRDSDLPLRIAFPVLMANITNWLSPGQAFDAPVGLQPGQPVTIAPDASAATVVVEKPDGSLWTGPAPEGRSLLFDETAGLGLYHVRMRDAGGDQPAGSFAVNLFAPEESTIAPAATLQLGRQTVDAPDAGDVGRRELWAWLAVAGLLLLLLEWWVYFRGARLPTSSSLPAAIRRLARR